MRKFRVPLVVIGFVLALIIVVFSLIHDEYGFQIKELLDPQWVTYQEENGNQVFSPIFQILGRFISLIIFILLLTSALLFSYSSYSIAKSKKISNLVPLVASTTLFIKPIFTYLRFRIQEFGFGYSPETFTNLIGDAFRFFVHEYLGPNNYDYSIRPIAMISGFFTHVLCFIFIILYLSSVRIDRNEIINHVYLKNDSKINQSHFSSQDLKNCPYCAEIIMAEAILCKHCKSSLK